MNTFEWQPEYDAILDRIASTDTVDTEWPRLRDLIKYKIQKYLANLVPEDNAAILLMSRNPPRSTPNGGLKIPPFPPRIRLEGNPNEAPKHALTEAEASDFRDIIYRMLDDFEGPPFTIQRVCELCIHPQKHYKYVGKYLRAVEKTLLVTSTWDAFPIPSGTDTSQPSFSAGVISSATLSAPSTPIFSPIPFLHGDARRSQSRSPPPSPLALAAVAAVATGNGSDVDEKPLGLVDELDDPSPGHLSDHLQPISSTTSVGSKPIIPSLGDRFVSSTTETNLDTVQTLQPSAEAEDGDRMQVDEESEDKENKAA
ncbi:unnamed protein product [Somion occarium]|uniref:PPP4R2-domain-containing protein n=1 Tax=Somion occarium TaxID=3059160 RepID=A0ABP1D9D9_9APHY